MSTRQTRAEVKGQVIESVIEALRDCAAGVQGWHYVRVYRDGTIIRGREVSKCIPQSEYFGEDGCPNTIWSFQNSGMKSNDSFEWDEQDFSPTDDEIEEFKACGCFIRGGNEYIIDDGKVFFVTDQLVDDPEFQLDEDSENWIDENFSE